jgi:hypothetical protein
MADTTLAIVIGTYITNVFGMNMLSGLGGRSPAVFWTINVSLILGMAFISVFLFKRYNLNVLGTTPVINSKISKLKGLW